MPGDHRTRSRSPYRSRPSSREWDHGQRDGYNRSRQGFSRSPDRQGSRYESRERDDGYADRDSYGYNRRPRGPAYNRRDEHDYSGMYDDDRGYRPDEANSRGRHDNYDDRDNSGYRSPPRGRSYSHSPLRDAGRPTDTIILEGLPFSVSSSELQESIMRNSVAADLPPFDVRMSSSKGTRRAFVQFDSVDSAVFFIREHFPRLHVDLPQPTDEVPDGRIDVFIHYARSREDADARVQGGQGGTNWTCQECEFSNYATRLKCKMCGAPASAPEWQQSLTGLTDAANVPSQILVVYPLAGFVNEDMLASDMKRLELEKPNPTKDTSDSAPKLKSTAPTGNASGYGARPGSLHRVFLMRDMYENESFRYGFAEFWTLEDATAAMAKFRASRSFNVAACPVNVSTIHMGVFLPEDRELTPDIERMSFHPLFNPSLRVRYRDLRLYPSERVVTMEPPNSGDQTTSADDAKKLKKRKADGSLPSSATKKPVVMAGQMAMWQRKHDELHGQAQGSKEGSAEEPPRPEQSNAPIKISLSGVKIGGQQSPPKRHSASPEKTSPEEPSPPPQETKSISYVDRDRLMCLICMRKYKSVDEVNIHEKSRNHKQATENEELVKAALPRLATRDKRLQKAASQTDAQATEAQQASDSQYRDRAKERRLAYNQPTKPTASSSSGKNPDKKKDATPPPPPAPQPAKPSKGAGMLAKMGWAAGDGLGARGDGRTEVVATDAYQEGVGLGAEGGKLGDAALLAERKTTNKYSDYVSSVQDKARERYNKM